MTKVHVFPYSPRPGTRTAADDRVPVEVKQERGARLRALSDELCRRAGRRGSARSTACSSTGRGGGTRDDYTPWLVDGVEWRRSSRRAPSGSPTRGCSPLPPEATASSARSSATASTSHAADGFVAIRDIAPQAPTHLLVLPSVTSTRSATSASSRPTRRSACSSSSPRRRARRARGLPRARERRRRRRADRLPPPLAHPRGASRRDSMTLIADIEGELTAARKCRDDERARRARASCSTRCAAPRRSSSARSPTTRRCRCSSASGRSASRRSRRSTRPGREEQADREEFELEVLEEFMPEPLSEDELEEIVDDVIAEVGATRSVTSAA